MYRDRGVCVPVLAMKNELNRDVVEFVADVYLKIQHAEFIQTNPSKALCEGAPVV